MCFRRGRAALSPCCASFVEAPCRDGEKRQPEGATRRHRPAWGRRPLAGCSATSRGRRCRVSGRPTVSVGDEGHQYWGERANRASGESSAEPGRLAAGVPARVEMQRRSDPPKRQTRRIRSSRYGACDRRRRAGRVGRFGKATLAKGRVPALGERPADSSGLVPPGRRASATRAAR